MSTTTRKPARRKSPERQAQLEAHKAEIEAAAEAIDDDDPDFAAFLARWADRYGDNNLRRLWVQYPRATCLHKFGTWQGMGRQVRRGETAILLMHPRTAADPDNPDRQVFRGASWMALFDFAQTDAVGDFTERAPADADPALVTEVRRLRQEAVALHPDAGGSNEAFTAAWLAYEAAKARLGEDSLS